MFLFLLSCSASNSTNRAARRNDRMVQKGEKTRRRFIDRLLEQLSQFTTARGIMSRQTRAARKIALLALHFVYIPLCVKCLTCCLTLSIFSPVITHTQIKEDDVNEPSPMPGDKIVTMVNKAVAAIWQRLQSKCYRKNQTFYELFLI